MAGIAMLEHMQPDMLMIGTTLHDMSGAYLLGHLQDEHDWVSKIPVVCAISPDAVEDDINSIQGIAPKCEFIKTTWPPDHIAAKVRELLEAAAVSKTH
jgi:DNA-binding response OmpR family regulator